MKHIVSHSAWCHNMAKDGLAPWGPGLPWCLAWTWTWTCSLVPRKIWEEEFLTSGTSGGRIWMFFSTQRSDSKGNAWNPLRNPHIPSFSLLKWKAGRFLTELIGKVTGPIYASIDLIGISGFMVPFPQQILKKNLAVSSCNCPEYEFLAFEDWNIRPHTTWPRMFSLMLYWKERWSF